MAFNSTAMRSAIAASVLQPPVFSLVLQAPIVQSECGPRASSDLYASLFQGAQITPELWKKAPPVGVSGEVIPDTRRSDKGAKTTDHAEPAD